MTHRIKSIIKNNMNLKNHWENIYSSKTEGQMSWYEDYPSLSMKYLEEKKLPKDAAIIDIGGGQSRFAEVLIDSGYTNVSVLDISKNAIENNKMRMGEKSKKINWIVSDINNFSSEEKYDFWHDRAVLHFLTDEKNVYDYLQKANLCVSNKGFLTVGTFSENGPKKCSGIEIQQYSEKTMSELFHDFFDKIYCEEQIHQTPFNTDQNFIFCNFRHK